MKPRAQNNPSLRASFAAVAVLGLGALSGCVSIAGSLGPCTEQSGTFFGVLHTSTSINEKCTRMKAAEQLTKASEPDVVTVGLRILAEEDPKFGRELARMGEQELARFYNSEAKTTAPSPAQMVECDVVNVTLVGGRKEFDLRCPVAP